MNVSNATPSEEVELFQVICPTCGRHSDAEDTEFLVGFALPFPGSECLLAGITCGACGTRVDRALWPVGKTLPSTANGADLDSTVNTFHSLTT